MSAHAYNAALGQAQGQTQPAVARAWSRVTGNVPASLAGHSVVFRNNLTVWCVSEHGKLVGIQVAPGEPIVTVSRDLLERGDPQASVAGTYVRVSNGLTGLCVSDQSGTCSVKLTTQFCNGRVVVAHRRLLLLYR